ncbi:MAG: response regulator [Gemmatimonadota bacterium]
MADPDCTYLVSVQTDATATGMLVPSVRVTRVKERRHVPVQVDLPAGEFATRRAALDFVKHHLESALRQGADPVTIRYVEGPDGPSGAAADTESADEAGSGPPPPAARRRVLLVEDSPVAHEKISAILQDLGCAVVSAFDGAEALVRAKECGSLLDLVVLDIQMPRLDGIAALRYLRQMPGLAQVPIVMLTTQADKETVRTALSHKANDFIRKDASIPVIAERLRLHLKDSRRRLLPPPPPRDASHAAELARGILHGRRDADSTRKSPWVLFYESRPDLQDMAAGKDPHLVQFYTMATEALARLNRVYRGLDLAYGLEHERQLVTRLALREEAPVGVLLVSGRRPDGVSLARMLRFTQPSGRNLPVCLVCESAQALAAEQREGLQKANIAVLERGGLGPQELQSLLASHLVPEFRTLGSGLKLHELRRGAGPEPQPGQVVTLHATAALSDGTVFIDSFSDNQALQFAVGSGQVIAAWEEAVRLMRPGAAVLIEAGPELAYGQEGDGDRVPPGATITGSLEVLEIADPPGDAEGADTA